MTNKIWDVVGFGEAMVRFTAPSHERLEQASSLKIGVSAAELNVAVNLSNLGLKSAWVSKLVDVWSGRYIINKGREQGVDMSSVQLVPFDGVGRIRNGLSFLEIGVGPRPNRQIYDRGHSAISGIQPGEIDWDDILGKAKWYHTTGITTALSISCIQEVISSLKTARKLGLKTSFDLNFRSSLWSPDEAQAVMKDVVPLLDVVFGNEEDFEKMLGIKAEGSTKTYSNINPENYHSVAKKVTEIYPNIELVGTTLRDAKTGLLNDWQTAMLHQDQFYVSRKYNDLEIVDRTGGGDSFASALIYCTLTQKDPQEAIDFSAAYSALCHGFLGDWNWAKKEEAENVMKGATARVIR